MFSQPLLLVCSDLTSRTPAHQVDVINRGYSGYNTRWATHLLKKVFPVGQQKVAFVTLFWGANDAALPDRHRYSRTALSQHHESGTDTCMSAKEPGLSPAQPANMPVLLIHDAFEKMALQCKTCMLTVCLLVLHLALMLIEQLRLASSVLQCKTTCPGKRV